jgi:hypothetical protein
LIVFAKTNQSLQVSSGSRRYPHTQGPDRSKHPKEETGMPTLPPPPVPQGLRELLKDHPGHIQRLQEALNSYVQKPFRLMPFDGAIWVLEGKLETFIAEARQEIGNAETGGDPGAIALAKAKRAAFGSARADMGPLSELRTYFDA